MIITNEPPMACGVRGQNPQVGPGAEPWQGLGSSVPMGLGGGGGWGGQHKKLKEGVDTG